MGLIKSILILMTVVYQTHASLTDSLSSRHLLDNFRVISLIEYLAECLKKHSFMVIFILWTLSIYIIIANIRVNKSTVQPNDYYLPIALSTATTAFSSITIFILIKKNFENLFKGYLELIGIEDNKLLETDPDKYAIKLIKEDKELKEQYTAASHTIKLKIQRAIKNNIIEYQQMLKSKGTSI